MGDTTFSFLIDSGLAKGQAVRLGPCLDTIISQHAYPDQVGYFIAQASALATLLSGAIKYEGVFTLQVQSDGAISTLVINITSAGGIRGYARFDPTALENALAKRALKETALVPAFFGQGSLSFTVEQTEALDTYQGVVPLEHATLTECVQQYFKQSEQIQTAIRLNVAPPTDGSTHWCCGAIMLQRMPVDKKLSEIFSDEEIDELWRTAVILLNTASDEELQNTSLSIDKLVNRLYHSNDLHLFIPKRLNFSCRCSQDKVIEMLKRFPSQEQQAMVQDDKITVGCQFCGKNYVLTLKDLESGE